MLRISLLPGMLLLAVPPALGVEDRPDVRWLTRQLQADKDKDRAEAARRLGQLGPMAREAVPALAGALKDKSAQVRFDAAFALLRIDQAHGPEAFMALTALLEDKDASALHLLMLGQMSDVRPTSAEVVRELLKWTRHKHPLAPTLAYLALDNMDRQTAPAADLLRDALTDALADVRLRAAIGLLRSDGKHRQQAVTALRALLQDADASNRLQAAAALLTAGPEPAQAAVPVLTALAKASDARLRRQAIDVLAGAGTVGRPAAAALKELVKDADPRLAEAAGQALIRLHPEQARAHFAALAASHERFAQDGSADLLKLIEQLYKIEASRQDLIKLLTEQLRRKNSPLIRLDAVIRLSELGPQAKDAVGDLVKATADASPVVRSQALWALGQVGPDARAAVPQLLRLMRDEAATPRDLRELAGKALKAIDPAAAAKAGIP